MQREIIFNPVGYFDLNRPAPALNPEEQRDEPMTSEKRLESPSRLQTVENIDSLLPQTRFYRAPIKPSFRATVAKKRQQAMGEYIDRSDLKDIKTFRDGVFVSRFD